ncbi:MAG: class I SAM-dependent RNA methyltransferase [Clostridia bacterium]|nr:class I SAM-dependent RNA methyltransferase [Clostridia bacterium]
MTFSMFIPCLLGLEGIIADELRDLGASDVRAENGRVNFSGGADILARANIRLRCAERVLVEVGSFEAHSFDELFEGTKALAWSGLIGPLDAFPVKGYSLNSDLFSVSDCQSIIKKAVVDSLAAKYSKTFFEETGALFQIRFSIMRNRVTLAVDSSGAGLHKRGYRPVSKTAPLKETLAAALCSCARLRPTHTFYDPMCGSGTIAVEAALTAANIAPGINRSFTAENWSMVGKSVFDTERQLARSLENRSVPFFAYASDIDPEAVDIARLNAERAGVSDFIDFKVADIADFEPETDFGTLITNPPYGERLLDSAAVSELYALMGEKFVRRRGWTYGVLTPDEEFDARFGRKADKRRKLYNGMIKCDFYMFFKSNTI